MDVRGHLYGGATVLRKFQAGTTLSTAGIPVIGSGAASADLLSVEPMAANGALTGGVVGITKDTTGTVAATGITDSAELLVTVETRPDAIVRAKMNNGTTEDTALAIGTTTGASATGVVATGVTTIDDGAIWGYKGANAGEVRRADDAVGGVSVNFPNAIAIGDEFLVAAGYPCAHVAAGNGFVQLSTNLTQVDATQADADNDNFIIYDLLTADDSEDGESNSFYLLIANRHIFGATGMS